MLVIKNIDKLEHQTIGNWIVKGIDVDQQTNLYTSHNYIIRLSRNGDVGAAIVIERKAGQYGYNVSICYEEYDNVISINAVGKNELKNKDILFSLIQGILDSEYNKKN